MNAARISASLAIAVASMTAFAQPADTPSTAASQPNAVGVTPETAKAANDQAIKRSDVATVVRTGPTAADRARQAGHKVESSVAGTTHADGTTGAPSGNRSANLAPRPDRN
ncbi:hypothetical protein [Roseateles sp.]|uniref:hypothetical protein n=1 Tax=Roseateles sp. TaxID=1971397 RepID=UPI003265067F